MSYSPNANSFTPGGGGGAPPFRPGQPYNPYGQQQQSGQQPGDQQQQGQQSYNQGYQQQQGNYGGYNPYAQQQQSHQQQNQQQYNQYSQFDSPQSYGQQQQQYSTYTPPAAPEQQVYVPPVRATAPVSNVPFSRAALDAADAASAPAAPTMSLKIGGGTAPPKPAASISLSIGGGSKSSTTSATTAASTKPSSTASATASKTVTPTASKPATPVAGKSTSAPAAVKETKAAIAGAKAEALASRGAGTDGDALRKEVEAAADEETLKDLYGKDDELAAGMKPHINIVFIGHVDAGKSTMGGNILFLCGMVDKRTMEKYEKEAKEAGRESWYLSWALDSTSQEREKGKTVEVGRAYFETEQRRYTILDAPGHKNFVPSMISGAAQADVAVLVISARKGEFETGFEKGGQTREHAMLVKTAGVTKLIVVVNKMDDPTVMWDKERYDEIYNKLSPFLKGFGYNLKTDVIFIPVSGYTGANLKDPMDKSIAPWVEGPSLLGFLDDMALMNRKDNAPLMMPISEKYSDMGTVVVGKLESGRIKKGDNLLLMPNKTPVTITAIHNEMEDEVPIALCGDNVRVRLRGIEDEDILTGFVLTSVAAPVHVVTQFEAQLVILDHKNIICAGYGAVMHVHTLAEEVSLVALLHYYDKKTGKKSRRPPQFAKKGQKIIALIEVAAPVSVERFEDHPQLGRFTLRDEGKTIAIGKITKLIERTEDGVDVSTLSLAA